MTLLDALKAALEYWHAARDTFPGEGRLYAARKRLDRLLTDDTIAALIAVAEAAKAVAYMDNRECEMWMMGDSTLGCALETALAPLTKEVGDDRA